MTLAFEMPFLEIFLNLIEKEEQEEEAHIPEEDDKKDLSFQSGSEPQKVRRYWWLKQFFALHLKRFHHWKRNKLVLFMELVLPSIFVFLSMWVTSNLPPIQQPSSTLVDINNCKTCMKFFDVEAYNESGSSDWSRKYVKELSSSAGLGPGCVGELYKANKCVAPKALPRNVSNLLPISGGKCSCATGEFVCDPSLYTGEPPSIILSSGQRMFNVCDENVPYWLLRTWNRYGGDRNGGFTFGVKQGLDNHNLSYFLIDNEEVLGLVEDNVKVWFNNRWWMSPIEHLNAVNNLILRSSLPPNISNMYGIQLVHHPMNYTDAQYKAEVLLSAAPALLHSIAIIFAMSFVPASFIMNLIEERQSSSKHLQLVSGVHWAIYWIAAYVWDMMCYTFAVTLCICVFFIFQEEAYIKNDRLFYVIILLFLYGWSVIPIMYLASFFFEVPSSAFVTMSCLNIFLGITTTASTYVLKIFNDEDLRFIELILRDVYLMFPHFCLGEGIMKLAESYLLATSLAAYEMNIQLNLMSWSSLGKNMVSMFIIGFVSFIIVLLFEKLHKKEIFIRRRAILPNPQDEEEDVLAEKKRALHEDCSDTLILKYLSKFYKGSKVPAVNQICLGVKGGECFGLLGLNGAGKTTTFKMLTGYTSISFGDAIVMGKSIRRGLSSVLQHIGYCPQFDALDPKLTPVEHLYYYATLRNLPAEKISAIVDSNLRKFDLLQCRDVTAERLSGGNKRKLSTSIALLGNVKVVCLDEPTCGMDPKSKRFLWRRIRQSLFEGRAVILTTHSMNECEALCTKVTVMVNGEFKCFGSIQHLKTKYGGGYNIMVRVNKGSPEEVKTELEKELPLINEYTCHLNQIKFNLQMSPLMISQVIGVLEEAKTKNHITDYSLSQRTLEEIFLHFVRN